MAKTMTTTPGPGDRLTFDIWREDGFERVPVTVTVGQLDDAAKAVYRSGQSFGFALALQVRTGWPLVFANEHWTQGCRSRARAEATKGRAQRTFERRRAALSSPRQTPPRISGAASGSRIPTPGGSSSRSSFPQAGSPVS